LCSNVFETPPGGSNRSDYSGISHGYRDHRVPPLLLLDALPTFWRCYKTSYHPASWPKNSQQLGPLGTFLFSKDARRRTLHLHRRDPPQQTTSQGIPGRARHNRPWEQRLIQHLQVRAKPLSDPHPPSQRRWILTAGHPGATQGDSKQP